MDDTEIELDRDAAQLAFTPYEVDQKVAHAYSIVWHYEAGKRQCQPHS